MGWRSLVRPARLAAALAVMLACASARAAAECSAAVVVRGPEPVRTTIAAELSRAGIDGPRAGCPAEEVAVVEAEATLTLTLTDAYGRVTRRTVSDVGAACALIESRAGAEILAPLLPQGEGPASRDALAFSAEAAASSASPAPPSAAAVVSAPIPAAPAPARGLTLLVATELAAGSDNSGWAGLSVSGCVTLGPTCLGTLVRFWHDLDASDESANVIRQRDAGEIAISLALPFTRHRIELRPAAELGVGWVHMGGFGSHPDAVDDPDFDHGDVSAGLRLAAAFPLSPHWALEAGLGASISLFAHQAPFAVDGVMLPGEPRAFGLVSLGLRYGVP